MSCKVVVSATIFLLQIIPGKCSSEHEGYLRNSVCRRAVFRNTFSVIRSVPNYQAYFFFVFVVPQTKCRFLKNFRIQNATPKCFWRSISLKMCTTRWKTKKPQVALHWATWLILDCKTWIHQTEFMLETRKVTLFSRTYLTPSLRSTTVPTSL